MAEALFVTYFDDHKGQSLLWSRTAGKPKVSGMTDSRLTRRTDAQDLDGIELQALPSGLHLVEADTYHFRRCEPGTTGSDAANGRSQLGTVVFRNRPLSPEEVEKAGGEGKTRGRLMIGLGVLSSESLVLRSLREAPLDNRHDIQQIYKTRLSRFRKWNLFCAQWIPYRRNGESSKMKAIESVGWMIFWVRYGTRYGRMTVRQMGQ